MEKIDARKLGYEGRDTLRKLVLRLRKQSGLNGVELAKVAGVHVRTVQAWLRKAQAAGEGALTCPRAFKIDHRCSLNFDQVR
jgi:transposase